MEVVLYFLVYNGKKQKGRNQLRVIAGNYKGRKLKSLEGQNTRPTSDKIKGAVFNSIGPYFDEEVVLDLFSGSGNLAIEAVSRGAKKAFCVEQHPAAIKVIKANVEMTKEHEKFQVYKMKAEKALKYFAEEHQSFDLIFLDPPYAQQKIVEQIQEMLTNELIRPWGQIICETDRLTQLPNDIVGLTLKKRRIYGNTEIVIYQKGE